jgi:hypothetical protein
VGEYITLWGTETCRGLTRGMDDSRKHREARGFSVRCTESLCDCLYFYLCQCLGSLKGASKDLLESRIADGEASAEGVLEWCLRVMVFLLGIFREHRNKVSGRGQIEEVRVSFFRDQDLARCEDVDHAGFEDLCAESVASGESAQTDDKVHRGVLEDDNSNGEQVYLSVVDQFKDKVDFKVEGVRDLEVQSFRHEAMNGAGIKDSSSDNEDLVLLHGIVGVIQLGYHFGESLYIEGFHGVEAAGFCEARWFWISFLSAYVLSPHGLVFL